MELIIKVSRESKDMRASLTKDTEEGRRRWSDFTQKDKVDEVLLMNIDNKLQWVKDCKQVCDDSISRVKRSQSSDVNTVDENNASE